MSRIRNKINRHNPYLPTHVGIFEDEINVNGVTRRVVMYIPEGARASNAGIMILPEDGITAMEMLEKSSWREIADTEEEKEKITLMFLEPMKGRWDIQEEYGKIDGDVEYVKMAYDRFAHRDLFCVHESKFYMVGYGAGAAIAEMAAMYDPAVYAGIAAVAPLPVPENFMKESEKALCYRLNGFEDVTGLGLTKGQIPVPVWIIKDRDRDYGYEGEIAHWKQALDADKTSRIYPDTIQYIRTKETPSPLNQQKEAYRLWVSEMDHPAENHGRIINRRIWKKFLYPVRRWMSQPGGDLRLTQSLTDDLHMEYHYEEVDGWMREWYVYIPEKIKKDPEKKAPLVFAMHGYTCSGEIYCGNSGWHSVADQYGFIVIFPSAVNGHFDVKEENRAVSKDITVLPAWNIYSNPDFPDEIRFFDFMLKDAKERFCIDEGRVYITGHSMGSLMVQMLTAARPEWFAAAAPCSGVLFLDFLEHLLKHNYFKERKNLEIPIWMFGGEREEWLLPAIPEKGNITDKSIDFWRAANGCEITSEEKKEKGIYRELWHDYIYEKNGRDLVRYTWIKNLPHATMPEMSFRIWEEFFSKYCRDSEGKIKIYEY
ncbi:MAG: alpha/beta hydrolase family esterase [Ruminococcus sp.]|jgi:poly(3-hydroxybutyrate) depolymerase